MKFGWINLFGGIIVGLMLLPNIVYALRYHDGENRCKNVPMNLLEQAGRYGSMALMVLQLGVWKFAFPSVAAMLGYLLGNGVLLAGYWICWFLYSQKKTKIRALTLAVLPTCIFLLSGFMLRHWLLAAAAVAFGAGHIYVTLENNK